MKEGRKYVITKSIDQFLLDVKDAFQFSFRFFRELFKRPLHIREIIHQSYEVGVRSLTLITVTGFILGIVFTKQSRGPLEEFGAASWLPSLVGIAVVKALGPLVTALICSGKVGSAIGAQLGSMKVTEQIDAMEVSAINPYKYLVFTRVMATTITIPVLSFYCGFVALFGSFLNVSAEETTSLTLFFQNAFSSIGFIDVFTMLAKSIVFGFTIGIIGCYKGFHATKGTLGVGNAANHAVVLSMFLVFIEEILIVQVSNWIIGL